ncbi:MAG: hypothetical protein WC451_02565 [Patescibacteria group bacterium]
MSPDEVKLGEKELLYSRQRMDLTIKECPPEIAQAFFVFARTKWHGKQWVALQDLIQIAKQQEILLDISNRLSGVEKVLENHDLILSHVHLEITDDDKKPGKKEERKPVVFGDSDE